MNIHRSARTTFASRALLVERVRKQGWSVEEAASAFGISDTSVRKWLRRFEEGGIQALQDRTSKPQRQPLKTPPSWEQQILELRAARMTVQRIAQSLSLRKPTVARVLARLASRGCLRCTRRRRWYATSGSGRETSSIWT